MFLLQMVHKEVLDKQKRIETARQAASAEVGSIIIDLAQTEPLDRSTPVDNSVQANSTRSAFSSPHGGHGSESLDKSTPVDYSKLAKSALLSPHTGHGFEPLDSSALFDNSSNRSAFSSPNTGHSFASPSSAYSEVSPTLLTSELTPLRNTPPWSRIQLNA